MTNQIACFRENLFFKENKKILPSLNVTVYGKAECKLIEILG